MGKGKKKKNRNRHDDDDDVVDGVEKSSNSKQQQRPEDKDTEKPQLTRKQKRMLKLEKKMAASVSKENESVEDEKEEFAEEEESRKQTSAFSLMESSDDEDEENEDVPKATSAFDALALSDSDEEDEDEVKKTQKKKKKKKEKGGQKQSSEDQKNEGDADNEMATSSERKSVKEDNGKLRSKDDGLEEDSSLKFDVPESDNQGEEQEEEKKSKKEKKKKDKKLSNKERRKLNAQKEKEQREAELKEMSNKETDFAVSATANTLSQEAWENATDIDIPEFTISAHGKTLFRDATLKISAGRRYGLVGPNGMGKSTLLKQIARGELKIPPKIDCLYVEQEVIADETPAVEMVLKADIKRTELLEEENQILKKLDEADDLDEAELNELQQRLETITQELRARGSDSAEARALSLLHGLGFTPEMQRAATKTFSGGWRMRVSIARALFMQPTLLLLDEPTNHLDLNAVIWLDDYLQKWKKTLLVVSHDQDFLDSVCTDIIHLDQQKLFYYKGNYSIFKVQHVKHLEKMKKAWEKQEKELKALRKAGKSNKKAAEQAAKKKARESGGAKGRKEQKRGSETTNSSGSLAERQLLTKPREYEVKFSFPDPTELTPPIIQVDNITFHYPNGPVLFKDLSFGIDMDSRITIVGPNGVGKSTLLKVITKELQVTEGEVTVNRHLRIARYHQHFVDILPMDESPIEFLRRVHDVSYQEGRNRLGKFGLSGSAHTIKMVNLSGGQKSRVVFASLSFQAPHILILDEPTNNLDIESIDALADAINDFSGGVILVSHDARLICSTDMRLWILENKTLEEMEGGFDAYRDEILEKLAKEEEEEKQRQEARIAARELERKQKLALLEEKRKAREQKNKK